jgi:hypothetical protein
VPLPPDFADECLYEPDAWFVHDVLQIDAEAHRVVALVDTNRLGRLVEAQKPWAAHPRHLPGAVVVQITGTLGNLHAVYVLGARPSQGWVGFGTHIRSARFPTMGRIGPPVQATLTVTRRRRFRGTWFLDYAFEFEQEGHVCYASEQTAAWVPPGGVGVPG